MQICVDIKSQNMFNTISWSEFIWFLAVTLVLYYLYVAIVYFHKNIFFFFRRQQEKTDFAIKTVQTTTPASSTNPSPSNELTVETQLSFIYDLLEDLKNLFALASKTKMVKEELIQAISSKLNNYPRLKDNEVSEDLNQHIRLEAKEQCGIELSPEDIKQLWHH